MNTVRAFSKDELYEEIRRELTTLFDLRPEQITLDARLKEDLDLDSIDAVDLIVRLQDLTKTRIKPEQFKAVRTVADVLDAVERTLRG
ncbi:MAG TPA: acyl carrier protein [Gammaproteobacteria bacterium]|jgi:acyl carrier protein|nr:acyl carrier protein [Gammaproteobacteria bacterium]